VITDSHAHLFWDDYANDLDQVVARAAETGIGRIVVVGTTVETSRRCFEVCQPYPGLFPTAGIHPHDAEGVTPEVLDEIEALCRGEECVAVGETGLDYFKEYSPREDQRRAFRWHLDLARRIDKPVIVHGRDAHGDTVELLRESPEVRSVMHCYTMGPDELGAYLELGSYVSFSGVVTYPKNEANREAAKLVPEDRLLVETDCPFLAPQGKRGKRNEPALVRKVLEVVAEVRGTSVEVLGEVTSENAAKLFRLGAGSS
jgi:TatD DNase family protein